MTYKKAVGSACGLMEVSYYGPISKHSFCYLRNAVNGASATAPALLVRMDLAMFAFTDAPLIPPGIYAKRNPAAAVIVRREEYSMWSAYLRLVAATGIKRALFCDSQLKLARIWAEEHACLKRELSPR